MNRSIGEKLYYLYYGDRVRFRKEPINMINVVKLFILKFLMAGFLSTALLLLLNPNTMGDKALTMSISSSCFVMGVCFLYLVNRKLVRMRI